MAEQQGSYNQIPPQCEGSCGLTQEKVDKHHIPLTLNCDGPRFEHPGDTYEDMVVVEGGKVVDILPHDQSGNGRPVCINKGFAAWLTAKTTEYQNDIS